MQSFKFWLFRLNYWLDLHPKVLHGFLIGETKNPNNRHTDCAYSNGVAGRQLYSCSTFNSPFHGKHGNVPGIRRGVS